MHYICDELLLYANCRALFLKKTVKKLSPKLSAPLLHFGDEIIKPSISERNIGVIFDSEMSLVPHVNNICKTSFYHLRNISRIRKFMSVSTAEKLVHAFVTSRLDNCNSLLYGISGVHLDKLQHVLNSAARIVTLSKCRDHITPLLKDLHWLPVRQRINYKILLLTFKALHGLTPSYISELISVHTNLKERFVPLKNYSYVSVKPYSMKTYGSRSFSVAAPTLWSSLPSDLRNMDSLLSFKKELKTYLFSLAFRV
ncbi:hypothetical protein AC249_AIPGENE3691 [Exaiptasia diaphana]|nr:hypothetical protein AC249_AIPGENE3691 [Exaiptasia diaphana]